MKKQLLCLALLLLIAFAMVPVQAQTITMANPGGIAERDIIVYWPNGTMYGFYNSTSVITLYNTSDYIFTMKPIAGNPLDDPADFVTTGFAWLQSNFISLIVLAVILGVLVYRR